MTPDELLAIMDRRLLQARIEAAYEETPEGCWRWTEHIGSGGYGRIKIRLGEDRVNLLAHRVAYAAWVRPAKTGMDLDHLCRNRWCVRPSHLEEVTRRDNALRGMGPSAIAYRHERCVSGRHDMVGDNLYITHNGTHRSCRACHQEWERAYRRRKRIERGLAVKPKP